jgi:hypothetical protein
MCWASELEREIHCSRIIRQAIVMAEARLMTPLRRRDADMLFEV